MMGNAPVRLAVVGAGVMGRRHLEAISETPACRAVAVADPTAAGRDAAAQWDLPHYDTLDALLDAQLDSGTLDGVIIATPNALHVPQALACIDRGLPVLVEKPVADTVDAAEALADASEAAGVSVLVGHHRRHNPIIAKAREAVQSGLLGRLTAVSATWLARKPDAYFDVAWRREPGGGPVLINLIHDVDTLRFVAGEIAEVHGMTAAASRGLAVEDTAALLVRFAGGALGTILVSDAAASPWSWELTAGERTSYTFPVSGQDCYLLAGTAASLAVPSLRLWRPDGEADWHTPFTESRLDVTRDDPFIRQANHFAAVIHGRAEPILPARDAARTLAVTLAVKDAAGGGNLGSE